MHLYDMDSFRRHHSSFNSIKSMIVKGYIKNDYTLLESIDIPEKVGVEEVRHIGKVLEQALPNAGDSPKLGDMRLSPPNQ